MHGRLSKTTPLHLLCFQCEIFISMHQNLNGAMDVQSPSCFFRIYVVNWTHSHFFQSLYSVTHVGEGLT